MSSFLEPSSQASFSNEGKPSRTSSEANGLLTEAASADGGTSLKDLNIGGNYPGDEGTRVYGSAPAQGKGSGPKSQGTSSSMGLDDVAFSRRDHFDPKTDAVLRVEIMTPNQLKVGYVQAPTMGPGH